MQSGGNLGGAAKLDLSSDSDQDPHLLKDSSEIARRVPPNAWASVDLAEYNGGTLYVGASSHAYCVHIKFSTDDVRTLVNVVRFLGRELANRPVNEGLHPVDRHRITWSHPRYSFKVSPSVARDNKKGFKLF